MNVRVASRVVLAVAVVLGLLAAVLVARYVNTATTRVVKVKMANEVMAAQDIPAGTVIDAKMLKIGSVPAQYATPGAASQLGAVVGHVAKVEIFPGEVVFPAQVATTTSGAGLAFIIPKGQVALTIAVDQLAGFDGLLKAGDRVDVLGVLTAGNGVPTQRVTTILRSVRLLAVGTSMDPATTQAGYATATLAVSPHNAEELVYLERFESLTLTLQSATHRTTAQVSGFDQNQMAGVLR